MDYYENIGDSEKKKIPFDSEPIIRDKKNYKFSSDNDKKPSVYKWLVICLCAETIVFSVLFGILFNKLNSNSSLALKFANPIDGVESVVDTPYGKAMRSSVSIEAFNEQLSGYNVGSGVIVSQNNSEVFIVTNYHVCYLTSDKTISDNIFIFLCDYINPEKNWQQYYDRRIKCEFVGGSYNNDIAILKFSLEDTFFNVPYNNYPIKDSGGAVVQYIERKEISVADLYYSSNAMQATIADSSDIAFGDSVFAVGNPNAAGMNVSSGIVSKNYTFVNVDVRSNSTYQTLRCIQIDTPINKGNSGGGLFDSNGNLVGIVNAKQDGLENTAYAIPVNVAIGVAWNIVENNGVLKLCLLGVVLDNVSYTDIDAEGRLEYKSYSVVSSLSLIDSQIAYNAGIKVDDVIVGISYYNAAKACEVEVVIDKPYELQDQMFFFKPGDSAVITVERNGESLEFNISFDVASTIS